LLVQDVENIDPVLNPVLNKGIFIILFIPFLFFIHSFISFFVLNKTEIYKKGGRILIKLGDLEVDFSPSFVIFLSTR